MANPVYDMKSRKARGKTHKDAQKIHLINRYAEENPPGGNAKNGSRDGAGRTMIKAQYLKANGGSARAPGLKKEVHKLLKVAHVPEHH